MTIFTQTIIIFFILYKMVQIKEKEVYKILTAQQDNFFSIFDEVSNTNHGFAVAAAITNYDGSSEDITDPSVGELKFYTKGWGDTGDGENYAVHFIEHESDICP